MTSQTPPRGCNAAGLIGFGLAVVHVLAQVILSGVTVAVPLLLAQAGESVTNSGVIFAVIGVGQVLWCVAVTVFGVIGVTRRDSPRILAAVALGVGASGVVIGVASLILPAAVGELLSLS